MASSWDIPGPIDEAVGRKKKKFVKWVMGQKQGTPKKNAPIRGTGDRQPRYYR